MQRHAIPSDWHIIENKFAFQQNNDTRHSSKLSKLLQVKKEQNFGNYNLVASISWPHAHWISMDWFGQKSESELFHCLKNAWPDMYIFYKKKMLGRMSRICKS